MAFSVVAEGKDNHTLKLLLEKSNGNSNYDKTIEKFIDFIRDYHLTENSAAESEITKSESSNGIILVHLNSETNKIEWLDPLPADVRARLNKKE
ncbi:hypothetical protein PflQ2_4515 [Pseudomonas fluorescens Q2-87]|uniref:Uncharacterized protein n=2 Tax=Pseudomonas TaxID=286 RepID=J2EKT5_PSEFQ|nr:hypothetical protein [Pseudomonas fluorescens]EJL04145.1 hypothetical protein PflQ2_4515 [Pseudomonas fluorescens Q2-87]